MLSCGQNSSVRNYQSLDVFTGGYNDFQLDLKSNGSLNLLIKATQTNSNTESGNIEVDTSMNVTGKWKITNSRIVCTFDYPRSSIDSFFIKADFTNTFFDRQIVTFSPNLDTAFIFGIPSILINKK